MVRGIHDCQSYRVRSGLWIGRSEEHTSELQSQSNLVCRLLLEKKKTKYANNNSDMDLAARGLGANDWNNSRVTTLSPLPTTLFRIRTSRNFGMTTPTMTSCSMA